MRWASKRRSLLSAQALTDSVKAAGFDGHPSDELRAYLADLGFDYIQYLCARHVLSRPPEVLPRGYRWDA